MLRKLRIKFVALIMGIVAVLLTCAFAAICYMDRQQSISDTDIALEAAIQQASGTLAVNAGGPVPPGQEDAFDPAALDPAEVAIDHVVVDDQGALSGEGHWGEAGGIRSIYPATKSGRFNVRPVPDMFTAVYKQEGDGFLFLQEVSSAMWTPEVVGSYADELRAHADGTGMLGSSIYFMKRTLPEGCFVAMVYAGPIEAWKGLAASLAAVGAGVLVAFLGISIAFSRWALRPVERAWAQQQRFVADASHDLKTPITVILANTSILLDESDQPAADRERWLQSTRAEAEGMQQLVQDMLLSVSVDVPTGGAGATGVRAAMLSAGVDGPAGSAGAPCDAADAPADDVSPALPDGALVPAEAVGDQLSAADLSRIAAREALQFESVAFDRCIKISTDVAPEVRVAVSEADLRRLVQILLDNACKYADEGGTVSLALRTDAAARRAQLSVSNTGPGIAAADLLHIFDRFYRADAARTSHEGHGLGLAIARAIVERAGGTIAATSDDRLTTLTATFPVAAL